MSEQGNGIQDALYEAARRTALIAAVFCLVVVIGLAANSLKGRAVDPLRANRLQDRIIDLNRDPKNEKLLAEIRRMDAQVRRDYWLGRRIALTGFYLLLGGVIVLLGSLEIVRARRTAQPVPRPEAVREAWVQSLAARRSVLGLGAVMAGVLLLLTTLSRHDSSADYARLAAKGVPLVRHDPAGQQETNPPPAQPLAPATLPAATAPAPAAVTPAAPTGGTLSGEPAPPPPSAPAGPAAPAPTGSRPAAPAPAVAAASPYLPPAAAAHWPAFRGPAATGIAPEARPPASWNAQTRQNLRWKAAIPLPGWNSPIVWGDRVYLTGADASRREVYCYDARDGKLLWRTSVPPTAGAKPQRIFPDAGFAPSTAVTDGQRICAIFVNGDVACLDTRGKILWQRNIGVPENAYAHAASLIIYGRGLIVQMDQGMSEHDGKSALMALDLVSGKTIWQVKRPVPNSWSTPLIIRAAGKDQIITCASPLVIAYDAATGTEIWRAEVLGGEVAASPTLGGGMVLVANEGGALAAIRPDGSGDVTKTHVAWLYDHDLPDIASPVASNELVFMITTNGYATAVDIKTGQKVWLKELKETFRASPILADGKLFLQDAAGTMHILEANRTGKLLGTCTVGEETNATPAFVGRNVFIRGKQHLFCIGPSQ